MYFSILIISNSIACKGFGVVGSSGGPEILISIICSASRDFDYSESFLKQSNQTAMRESAIA